LRFRDKRNAVNLKDYIIENIENGEVLKMPGSVNGQQFVIQNCKNTSIYVFDHANTVTVDDCINCKIILAAVKGRYVVNSHICFCIFFNSCEVSKLQLSDMAFTLLYVLHPSLRSVKDQWDVNKFCSVLF
jgi:hypothetical protein